MGECFKETRPAGKPSGNWQEAVWRDISGLSQIRNGKTVARRKGGRTSGRPWHENGPNSIQEETAEEEELVATLERAELSEKDI